MSRKAMLLAVALTALSSTTALRAQTSFGVAAGASVPTGRLGDAVDGGFHVMGSMSIMPPLAPIGFRIDGMYNEFNQKGAFSGKTRIVAATGNAVLTAPGVMGPYLIGGVGVYGLSTRITVNSTQSDTKVGFNVGAGFRFGLSGFSAFGEARYHYVQDGNFNFVPISFGITF